MDWSVTSSLSQGGKSMLESLPCHGFPGLVLKDRLEPAVVSACLIEVRLGGHSSILLSVIIIYFHDIVLQMCVHINDSGHV